MTTQHDTCVLDQHVWRTAARGERHRAATRDAVDTPLNAFGSAEHEHIAGRVGVAADERNKRLLPAVSMA